MDPKKDIFEQFRDQQDRWDETPPPSAWDRLESRLAADAPPHPGRPWKPFVLGGTLLLLLGIGAWCWWSAASPTSLKSQLAVESTPQAMPPASPTPPADASPVPEADTTLRMDLVFAPTPPIQNRSPQRLASNSIAMVEPINIPPRTDPRAVNWDSLLPRFNYAAFDYDTAHLNYGNMVVTNVAGNVRDTVQSLAQYRGLRAATTDNVYLQLNTRRNELDYRPRSGRSAPDAAQLEHFKWLLGSWKRQGPGGGSIETWQQVDEFTIEGRGYFLVNGDTLLAEQMRIEQRGKDVYYIVALDSNRRPVKFRLRSVAPGEAVFRNGRNQFPKEITLRQQGGDHFSTIFNENDPDLQESRNLERTPQE